MRDPSADLDAIVEEVARILGCDRWSVSLRYRPERWSVDALHVEGETGDPDEDPVPEDAPVTIVEVAQTTTLAEMMAVVKRRAPTWRAEAMRQIRKESDHPTGSSRS